MNPNGLEQFWGYVEAGGLVMPPLVAATLVLWYVLGLRLVTLQRGAVEGLPVLVQHGLEGTLTPRGVVARAVSDAVEVFRSSSDQLRTRLDEALYPHQQAIKVGQTVVRVIVLTAPLAGLLGTVSGMIETFDSLADMAMFTQTGGIAAGISQALITTQMGLIVAAPGVVVGRILEKRQHLIEDELERIKDMFCAMEAP
ncbi:MAG: MotA/TolQ/ExbB proton channel family protein [bacterium]